MDDGNGKEYYVESVTVTPFEMSVKQVGREKSIINDLVLYVLDAEGKHIDVGLSGGAEDVLSVYGHDLSKIDIYYVSWDFWENEIKGNDKLFKSQFKNCQFDFDFYLEFGNEMCVDLKSIRIYKFN